MEKFEMNIKNIEYYFQEDRLDELFIKYEECFIRIKYYEDSFKKCINTHETDRALKELGAIYSSLNVVADIALSWAKDIEAKEINTLKIQAENENKKVIASLLENQAFISSQKYRRIAVYFNAVRNSCYQLILICQS